MAPVRGLIRFTLQPGAPTVLVGTGTATAATPFGRWMLERVASAMLDWPEVAFHRVEISRAGLEVVLILGGHAPPPVQCNAIAAALGRELEVAARRGSWVRGALWRTTEVALGVARVSANSAPSLAPSLRSGQGSG